jgi:hypothetical protein
MVCAERAGPVKCVHSPTNEKVPHTYPYYISNPYYIWQFLVCSLAQSTPLQLEGQHWPQIRLVARGFWPQPASPEQTRNCHIYIYIYIYVCICPYIYIYMALSRLLPCPERALSARSIRRSAVASATRAGRPSSRHSIANERLQGVGAQTHQTLSEAYTHTCVYVYVWVSTTSFSGGALRRFGLGICGPS